MKLYVISALALCAVTSPAIAATTVSASNTFAAPAGSTAVLTFNFATGTAAEADAVGIDVAFVGLARRSDNSAELTDSNGTQYNFFKPGNTDGSGFFGVAGTPASVTFTTRGVGMSSISLFAGSIDEYNRVDLLGLSGNVIQTITGTQMYGATPPFPGSSGDQFANKRVTFTGTDGTVYGGVRMYNTGANGSFEFDNLAFTAAAGAVPEPATWGLMLMGFFGIGSAMRRRSAAKLTFA